MEKYRQSIYERRLRGADNKNHNIDLVAICDCEYDEFNRFKSSPTYHIYIDNYLFMTAYCYQDAEACLTNAMSAVLDRYLELNLSEDIPE